MKTKAIPILILCLFLVGCAGTGLQIQNPADMSVTDLRLVATKTYNQLYDYHVMKSQMVDLTKDEKTALNDLKKALSLIRGPLREFQMLVENNMVISPELKQKIVLFVDHWAYEQTSK